jgi:hypothetical protein
MKKPPLRSAIDRASRRAMKVRQFDRKPRKDTIMNLRNMPKNLVVPMSLLGVSAASAAAPHSNLPTCYIHVHDGCFNNQSEPCTDEEYDNYLDGCDAAYPSARPAPRPPADLVAPSSQTGGGSFKVKKAR